MRMREGTVSAAKHQAILDAAMQVFLNKGYAGTSMDEVAACAEVGKQTVYKHFSDKRQLFTDIVLSTTDQIDRLVRLVAESLDTSNEVQRDLSALARRFLTTLMQPRMLRLRRLVISSAAEFPELGSAWYERGFGRALETLASSFTSLHSRGLLNVPEPQRAAEYFVGMLLWIPLNKAMFTGDEAAYTEVELHHRADLAVSTFLRLHRLPNTTIYESSTTNTSEMGTK